MRSNKIGIANAGSIEMTNSSDENSHDDILDEVMEHLGFVDAVSPENLKIFNDMLDKKLSPFEPEWIACAEHNEEVEIMLIDELDSRSWWTGNIWKDFWIRLKNNHPYIGSFTAHPFHRRDKKERIIIFLAGIFLAFYWVVVRQIIYCSDETTCFDTCNVDGNDLFNDGVCSDGYEVANGESIYNVSRISGAGVDDRYTYFQESDGIFHFNNQSCGYGQDCMDCGVRPYPPDCHEFNLEFKIVDYIFSGILSMILVIMKQLANCSCDAKLKTGFCKTGCEVTSHFLLFIMFLLSVYLFYLGIKSSIFLTHYRVYFNAMDFVQTQLLSQVYSVGYEIPSFYPSWKKGDVRTEHKVEAAEPAEKL